MVPRATSISTIKGELWWRRREGAHGDGIWGKSTFFGRERVAAEAKAHCPKHVLAIEMHASEVPQQLGQAL